MNALIRSAVLTSFIDVAASCGLDARALLVDAGLPQRCLDDPDLKVPARAVAHLLELAAERGHEPAFGLRLAESRRLSNLGPLGLLVRDEPTLRSALEALMRHIHVHNEALSIGVEQHSNLVVVSVQPTAEGGASLRQSTELGVGVAFRVLQIFMGAGWQPRLVCFTHPKPASLTVHRRLFGPAVEFGHQFNGIVCNASDLDLPNPGADAVMVRYSQRLLEQTLDKSSRMSDRVRQLVVVLLPRGLCRVEIVAQHLGVDRRTVARRLAEEQTSFSALVNELRRDLFVRYLKDGARTLTEVSALLGFSASSAFSRWHRQQFGIAARQLEVATGPGGPRQGHDELIRCDSLLADRLQAGDGRPLSHRAQRSQRAQVSGARPSRAGLPVVDGLRRRSHQKPAIGRRQAQPLALGRQAFGAETPGLCVGPRLGRGLGAQLLKSPHLSLELLSAAFEAGDLGSMRGGRLLEGGRVGANLPAGDSGDLGLEDAGEVWHAGDCALARPWPIAPVDDVSEKTKGCFCDLCVGGVRRSH